MIVKETDIKLDEEIAICRKRLYTLLENQPVWSAAVIRVSETLDRLITEYYKKRS